MGEIVNGEAKRLAEELAQRLGEIGRLVPEAAGLAQRLTVAARRVEGRASVLETDLCLRLQGVERHVCAARARVDAFLASGR